MRCKVEWACVVNRKTYNSRTDELIEDLDIHPDIPKDVLRRTLPDGMTNIKTIFEYGVLPNITGTNRGNWFVWSIHGGCNKNFKEARQKELVIPLLYPKAYRSFTGVSWITCILAKIICYIYKKIKLKDFRGNIGELPSDQFTPIMSLWEGRWVYIWLILTTNNGCHASLKFGKPKERPDIEFFKSWLLIENNPSLDSWGVYADIGVKRFI